MSETLVVCSWHIFSECKEHFTGIDLNFYSKRTFKMCVNLIAYFEITSLK